jgi:hypothetical protein
MTEKPIAVICSVGAICDRPRAAPCVPYAIKVLEEGLGETYLKKFFPRKKPWKKPSFTGC